MSGDEIKPWRGRWRYRHHAVTMVTMALFLMIAASGCASGAMGGFVDLQVQAEPTPWVEGTLRAAIGATVEAASTPALPTPTARLAARAPAAPRATAAPNVPSIPEPPPRPAATPRISQNVRIEPFGFTASRLESGWTFIQGFVQNSGNVPAGNIDLVILLITDGGATVGSTHAHIKPNMLKPGGRSPWLAQVRGVPDFQRVRVEAHSHPLSDFLETTVMQDFRLEGTTVRPPVAPFSPPSIVGEVFNVGGKPATDVEVIAAIFDDEGALFQVARAVVKASEIAPGGGSPFEIRPIGRGLSEIPRYELYVQGRPKP